MRKWDLFDLSTQFPIFYYLQLERKSIRNGDYNPDHNILELYNILLHIRFTKSKRKFDV